MFAQNDIIKITKLGGALKVQRIRQSAQVQILTDSNISLFQFTFG